MGKKKKEDYKLSDLKRMGSELLSSQKKYVNNLPILIGFLKPSSPPNYVMESLLSLQSFFTLILTSINNTNKHLNNPDSADFIYNTWMRSKFDDFTNSLLDIFVSRDQNGVIRQVVMDTIMDFVKMGGAGGNVFNSSLYHAFINSILRRMTFIKDDDDGDSMLHVFASKYFDYMDVRYFTYISIHNIATTLHTNSISTDGIDAPDSLSSSSKDLPIKNMLYILLHIPPPDASTTKEPDHSPMWTASSDSPSKEAKRKHLKLDKSNNNFGIVMSLEGLGTETSSSDIKTTLSYTSISQNSHAEELSKPYPVVEETMTEKTAMSEPVEAYSVTQQAKGAKIHDFCFGIPFGGLVLIGGLIGFMFTRNLTNLGTGVLFGGGLLALSTFSLQIWRQGKSSIPFILGQAVLAGTLLWKNVEAYSTAKKLFPTGFYIVVSAAMLCFYLYVMASGGNPPPKKKSKASS